MCIIFDHLLLLPSPFPPKLQLSLRVSTRCRRRVHVRRAHRRVQRMRRCKLLFCGHSLRLLYGFAIFVVAQNQCLRQFLESRGQKLLLREVLKKFTNYRLKKIN